MTALSLSSNNLRTGKRLIVNADDFGMHESINKAVEAAHAGGILISASLAACGDSFDEAIAIVRRNPRLGVGVHLTFVEERPLLPKGKIPSITGEDGMFHKGHTEFLLKMLSGRISLRDIAAECECQIARIFDSGITPTHIDSHQHLHLLPPVFKAIEPVLKKFGLRRIRLLKIPYSDYKWRNIKKSAFAIFARFNNTINRAGYEGPDNFYGFFNSGAIDKPYFKKILARLSPGVAEIGFHPGADNAVLCRKYRFWRDIYGWPCDWEGEYRLLTDSSVKKLISDANIVLINYKEF